MVTVARRAAVSIATVAALIGFLLVEAGPVAWAFWLAVLAIASTLVAWVLEEFDE